MYYIPIQTSKNNIIENSKIESLGEFSDHCPSEVLNEYSLLIPKEWARGESSGYLGSQERVEEVPHYELYIEKQIGSYRNRKDTFVFLRLPRSKKVINIVLHKDGGVSFDKQFNKYVLRELDELDRTIILGFCDKYHDILVQACYKDGRDPYLDRMAATYKASNYKKRIKRGPSGNDNTDFYIKNGGLNYIEEDCGIFNMVKLI